uniref:Uncharacterized protein n=1 Tax=Anopheles minimus TaxID=112268 RepID=A0A182WI56_9DIPT
MEDAVLQEAKQMISLYMSNDSASSLADASFNEREHLAELHKQIELRKAYRDSLRSLNLGLYALKQGAHRNGSDTFGEQLAKDYHASIGQVIEKQREASHGLQQLCHEFTLLGNSRQALVEQAESQKLQNVLRLQEQVRVKLASTRVVKQWERERATLLSEQKEMSKLEVVGKEIMQKRNEMLERRHSEVANTLISIGEGLEKAEELRMKLVEISKQHRYELHEDQCSEADLRSDDAKKDSGPVETDREINSAPMFDSIDWNLGNVSMDLQLDLNFKNPNDFPDILTHLSVINTSKYHIKNVTPHTVTGRGDKQNNLRKVEERKNAAQKGNKVAAGKTAFSEQSHVDATAAKKLKMNEPEKVIREELIGIELGNAKTNGNHQRVISTTPKCVQKKSNETVANLQHRVSRKKQFMESQHEAAPNQGPKASPIVEKKATPMAGIGGQQDVKKEPNSVPSLSRFRSTAGKTIGNNVGISGNQPKSKKESQSKHVAAQQKQPEGKRIRMLSPVCTKPAKSVRRLSTDHNKPIPMDVESDGKQDGDSTAGDNTSLDFAMQSGSNEFDMNFSDDLRADSGANQEDDLDFLSVNPGRVTRSKGHKKKTSSAKSSGSGDDLGSFDFTFGDTNSSESLDGQPEDLF